MLDVLRNRLESALGKQFASRRLTEQNIQESLREVRRALLEADVALDVARNFVDQVSRRAIGVEISQQLTAGQELVKIVHEELTSLMGNQNESLVLAAKPPTVILVAGLQGAGKTTTVAKLAKLLKEQEKKKVVVSSVDIYRPAAIDQLMRLAETVGVEYFSQDDTQNPADIARGALQHSKTGMYDVLIVDSAGRLHVDEDMMREIEVVHQVLAPSETLFVVDSTVGQDAVASATRFHEVLPLTGIIVTKLDGDTRGGALLSVREVTGKPVKFIGTGEHVDALENFHPERIASRILGMGDVMTLIESVERKVDQDEKERLQQKIIGGKQFDLDDYRSQLMLTQDMGGVTNLAKYIPNLPNNMEERLVGANEEVMREIAIINSMTLRERKYPACIRGSRQVRIAKGAGVPTNQVSRLLRKFEKMQKMTKKLGRQKRDGNMPEIGNFPFQQ